MIDDAEKKGLLKRAARSLKDFRKYRNGTRVVRGARLQNGFHHYG